MSAQKTVEEMKSEYAARWRVINGDAMPVTRGTIRRLDEKLNLILAHLNIDTKPETKV